MKKTLYGQYTLVSMLIIQSIAASDEDDWTSAPIPAVLPSDQAAIVDTFIPESCYRFTKNAAETVCIGPCSPCVAIKAANKDADEWLYFHHHIMNNPADVGQKIVQHFTPPASSTKPNIDLTIFTRSDPSPHTWEFKEGTHKKRINHLTKKITENSMVKNQTIYFNVTENPLASGSRYRGDLVFRFDQEIDTNRGDGYSDRTILFAGNQPSQRLNHRGDLWVIHPTSKQRSAYLAECLLQICPDRVHYSAPKNIWNSYDDVPLYEIKEPNFEKIRKMPTDQDLISIWQQR